MDFIHDCGVFFLMSEKLVFDVENKNVKRLSKKQRERFCDDARGIEIPVAGSMTGDTMKVFLRRYDFGRSASEGFIEVSLDADGEYAVGRQNCRSGNHTDVHMMSGQDIYDMGGFSQKSNRRLPDVSGITEEDLGMEYE